MTATDWAGRTTAQRLRAARHVLRTRGDALTVGDLAYAIYVGLLTLALVGSPAALAVIEFLRLPPVMDALTSTSSGTVVGLLAGLVLAGAVAAGAARGPVVFDPFVVHALLGSDLPRARVAARAAALTAALCALVGGVVGGLIAGAFEGIAVDEAVAFVAGATLWGVVCWGGWLLGQRLGSPVAGRVAAALALASGTTAVVPALAPVAPWAWLAATWPGLPRASYVLSLNDGSEPVDVASTVAAAAAPGLTAPLVGLAVLAAVVVGCAPWLLGGLRTADVLVQVHRWQAATVATGTADLAGALALYRPRPRVGRRWRAVAGGSPSLLVARADLVGAARTPGRLWVGTVGATLVGALAATTTADTPVPGWVTLGVAGLLAVGPVGVLTDGFRDAARQVTGPPVLGYSASGLFARHAVAPLAWALVCASVGALIATAWGAEAGGGVVVAGATAVLAVALRLADSVRGPLPLELLVPVMTPVGDASAVLVAMWQVEMPLLAALAAAVSARLGDGDAVTASTWALAAAAGAVAITRRRAARL